MHSRNSPRPIFHACYAVARLIVQHSPHDWIDSKSTMVNHNSPYLISSRFDLIGRPIEEAGPNGLIHTLTTDFYCRTANNTVNGFSRSFAIFANGLLMSTTTPSGTTHPLCDKARGPFTSITPSGVALNANARVVDLGVFNFSS